MDPTEETRRPGRPRKGPTKLVRVPADVAAALEEEARQRKMPVGEVIRELVPEAPSSGDEPEGGPLKAYSFKLAPALVEEVDAAALREGVNRSEWIRKAIRDRLAPSPQAARARGGPPPAGAGARISTANRPAWTCPKHGGYIRGETARRPMGCPPDCTATPRRL